MRIGLEASQPTREWPDGMRGVPFDPEDDASASASTPQTTAAPSASTTAAGWRPVLGWVMYDKETGEAR
jgi:hypothetical protein